MTSDLRLEAVKNSILSVMDKAVLSHTASPETQERHDARFESTALKYARAALAAANATTPSPRYRFTVATGHEPANRLRIQERIGSIWVDCPPNHHVSMAEWRYIHCAPSLWRPIEEAPKDGMEAVVVDGDGYRYYATYEAHTDDPEYTGWYDESGERLHCLTLWHPLSPLPAPPKGGE